MRTKDALLLWASSAIGTETRVENNHIVSLREDIIRAVCLLDRYAEAIELIADADDDCDVEDLVEAAKSVRHLSSS